MCRVLVATAKELLLNVDPMSAKLPAAFAHATLHILGGQEGHGVPADYLLAWPRIP